MIGNAPRLQRTLKQHLPLKKKDNYHPETIKQKKTLNAANQKPKKERGEKPKKRNTQTIAQIESGRSTIVQNYTFSRSTSRSIKRCQQGKGGEEKKKKTERK